MADLKQYTNPDFYIPPLDYPITTVTDLIRYQADKIAEAVAAVIAENESYRGSIQTVGEGKYLRMRENLPSILDGEGEWNLPPAEENHVGEDTV